MNDNKKLEFMYGCGFGHDDVTLSITLNSSDSFEATIKYNETEIPKESLKDLKESFSELLDNVCSVFILAKHGKDCGGNENG